MKNLICLASLVFAFHAHALTSEQVASQFKTTLEPFFVTGTSVSFVGENGVHLQGRYFAHPSPSAGTIVITNGFGETFHKYVEVAYDLYTQGYSVFLYDHRGQGISDHLLPDPQKGYIDDFEFMIKDLKNYFENTVKVQADGPYYLLGHSMGGMVAARYLEEYPNDFKAAVLNAPMLEINFNGIWEDPAKWILDTVSFFGYDQFYVQGPTNPLLETFATQTMTHNKVRFDILNQGIRALDPQSLIWGPTARWVGQSLHAGLTGVKDAHLVTTPVLLFQAGQDTEVRPGGENSYCAKAQHCKLLKFAGAHHEMLMENDDIRSEVMAQILKQFNKPSTMDKNEVLF